MTNYTTLGGRVTCTQCNAMSKRTRQRCQAPAIKGKTKCRFHGGKSTGAKTAEGRAKIAEAHTVHGRETRAKRRERSIGLAELRCLEELGFTCGLYPPGTPRTRGRKPLFSFIESKQSAYLKTLSVTSRREAIIDILREKAGITSGTKSA